MLHLRLVSCFWLKLEFTFLRNIFFLESIRFPWKNTYIFMGNSFSTSSRDSVAWNNRKGNCVLFSFQTCRHTGSCVGKMLVGCVCTQPEPSTRHGALQLLCETRGFLQTWGTGISGVENSTYLKKKDNILYHCYTVHWNIFPEKFVSFKAQADKHIGSQIIFYPNKESL